jgi:hypothetical protein
MKLKNKINQENDKKNNNKKWESNIIKILNKTKQ